MNESCVAFRHGPAVASLESKREGGVKGVGGRKKRRPRVRERNRTGGRSAVNITCSCSSSILYRMIHMEQKDAQISLQVGS